MSPEFQLIYRYLASYGAGPYVTLGVGDDAALLALPPGSELVVSTDTQLEGRHFLPDTFPEQIATRVVSAAASDLAAMAAEPLGMTLALTLPDSDELWLHSFSMGLGEIVTRLGLPLIGGDLTRGPLSLTVTVLGHVPAGKALRRSGAKVGDRLVVSGFLGDAAAALALFQGQLPDIHDVAADYFETRFFRPSPRFEYAAWLREHGHAAIDISDGLLADVAHMAAASGLACEIDLSCLPLSPALTAMNAEDAHRWALTGGDDYELALAVPEGIELPDGLTVIGYFAEGEGVTCPGFAAGAIGFDHFSEKPE